MEEIEKRDKRILNEKLSQTKKDFENESITITRKDYEKRKYNVGLLGFALSGMLLGIIALSALGIPSLINTVTRTEPSAQFCPYEIVYNTDRFGSTYLVESYSIAPDGAIELTANATYAYHRFHGWELVTDWDTATLAPYTYTIKNR